MSSCSVYGLGLRVNVPIAGLSGLSAPTQIDVNVSVGCLPDKFLQTPDKDAEHYYTSAYLDERGQPALNVFKLYKEKFFRFNYSDGMVIVVDALGTNVWASGLDSMEETAACLLGPILGFVLRLRGVTCLHASSVAIDGRAIALVGPSGAGKSSTAAAFAKLGYPVLSDDVVALTDLGGHFEVRPAYPQVRLWPESAMSLFGPANALPRIAPNWDKRFLDLNRPGYKFQSVPLFLAAIYLLGERSSATAIESVSPGEGLIKIVSDTYATGLLSMVQRAQEFDLLSRLVETVPIRRAIPREGFLCIGELCEAIVEDLEQLGSAPHYLKQHGG